MTSRSDDAEQAYYYDLYTRLHACRDEVGQLPSLAAQAIIRPPATEEHLQAVEAALGFPIPSLLRLLYRTVADGGSLLTHPFEELVESADLPENLSRSGWRLHPAIERGLQRNRACHVLCDSWPDGFVHIGSDGHCSGLLDVVTGWIYTGESAGVLPWRRQGKRIVLLELSFMACSLVELCEDMLAHYGFGAPIPRWNGTHSALAGEWGHGHIGQLTPDMLDAHPLEDEARVWYGLYPGVEPLSWPSLSRADMQPADKMDDLA